VFCLWETLWYLATGKVEKAFRRFNRQGVRAVLAPGSSVTVHYRSIKDYQAAFAPYFQLERWRGIGVAVPPSYAESFAANFKRLFRLAAAVDPALGRCLVLRSLADHVVLTFRRSGELL